MIMRIKKMLDDIAYALKPAHTKPTFEWLTCTSRRYTFFYLALMMLFVNQLHRVITTFFQDSRLWTLRPMYLIFFVTVVSFILACWFYILNLDTIQDKLTASLKWLLKKIRMLDPYAPWDKIVMKDLHCDDELQDIIVALNTKSSLIQDHIDYLERLIWFIQHEFNTPLAITQLHLERLKKNWNWDDNEFIWLQEEINHMKWLVDSLVWLIKTKTEDFDTEKLSLSETITNVCTKLKALHEDARFDIDIQEDIVLQSNKQYIWAICRNICDNALKHWSDIVHISADAHHLRIQDNWDWIDSESLKKIRLPFRKSKPRSWKQEWFWLWLSLVKVLTEKLWRKVDVHSWEKWWTVFIFNYWV